MEKKLLLGDFAVARGAYEAGVRVATAYPGTPSTEITEELSTFSEVYSEWAPNEKVALEVGIGSAMRGARTIVSMKHVGLNVAADPLYTVAYTGVNGGLAIVVADDPAMHSSQNEQDARLIARAANVPVLEPSDSAECKEFTMRAFALSEEYDTPVILRLTTRVAHSQSYVDICERQPLELKNYEKNPQKFVMMPAFAKKRHVVVEERLNRLSADIEKLKINRIERLGSSLGVICAGGVYEYVKEALPEASIYKLGMVFPLPYDDIARFSKSVDKCIVIEELEPHIEDSLKAHGINVSGKEIFGRQGELSSAILRQKLLGESAIAAEIVPMRPPVMCAGCPHRAVFYTLKKLNLTVCADIGCYTLGAAAPLNAIDSVVCMGASIGMAAGVTKADKEKSKSVVAVIGDSTFVHSGITGLIDAVYNKANLTVVIVDNSTTGMTGHQPHPATGKTIKGEDTYKLPIDELCKVVGARSVITVDPVNVADFESAIRCALVEEGVSVVIARRPCVLLAKKKVYVGRVISDKCKKCGMCMKLGCPAIRKIDGKIDIDRTLCTDCDLCKKVCPFGAIKDGGEN